MSDPTHEIVPRVDTAPARIVLHPAVERMLAQSPTPETLREILALQREWEAGEAKRAYTRALVELRRDLPAFVHRDQKVDFQGGKGRVHYTHASLAATMEAVLPALTKHGFSLSWTPATDAKTNAVTVTASLTHRDGHSEHATISAPPDQSGSKSVPQAIASTMTLLQRYSAMALLGIATSDMEEPKSNGAGEKPDGEAVDSARNMRAMAAISKAGKTREDAEKLVGRAVPAWTSSDLDRLRAWIEPKAEPLAPPVVAPALPIAPPLAPGLWKGFIKDVETKPGETKGKKAPLYTVVAETGERFGTYSETDAEIARTCASTETLAIIDAEATKNGLKIKSIVPMDAAEVEAENEIPF